MYYLHVFFFFSILGHFLEEFFYTTEPGILFGYWTPIYGIGSVVILFLYSILKKYHLNKWIEVILVFLNGFFILTMIEWVGGTLIEHIFNITFWDYSDHPLALGKYISVPMACVWGACSLVLVYVLKRFVDPLLNKIPSIVPIVLSILLTIDIILKLTI